MPFAEKKLVTQSKWSLGKGIGQKDVIIQELFRNMGCIYDVTIISLQGLLPAFRGVSVPFGKDDIDTYALGASVLYRFKKLGKKIARPWPLPIFFQACFINVDNDDVQVRFGAAAIPRRMSIDLLLRNWTV